MSTALIKYLHYQPMAGPFSYFDISRKGYYSAEERKLGFQSLIKAEVEPLLSYLESDDQQKLNLCFSTPVLKFLQGHKDYLKRFRRLIKSGQLELLAGDGYNSLSILFSRTLFQKEMTNQSELLLDLFDLKPEGFMNSAMLYSDAIGEIITEQGFKYALVPKIAWFSQNSSSNLFKDRTGTLKLFAVDKAETGKPKESAHILMVSSLSARKLEPEATNSTLLSELLTQTKLSVYSLPELVAMDASAGGLDMIIGNNLQKDFLSRLSELGSEVSTSGKPDIIADFLWLGSLEHFIALANKSKKRYKTYTKLLTMLYDLEIRLR